MLIAKHLERAGCSLNNPKQAALFLPAFARALRRASAMEGNISSLDLSRAKQKFISAADKEKTKTLKLLNSKAEALFNQAFELDIKLPDDISLANLHLYELPKTMTSALGRGYDIYVDLMKLHDTYVLLQTGKPKNENLSATFGALAHVFKAISKLLNLNIIYVIVAIVGGSAVFTLVSQGLWASSVATVAYTLLALMGQHLFQYISGELGSYFKQKSRFHYVERLASDSTRRTAYLLLKTSSY